ncbi:MULTISPECIES: molybdopterin-dependent oxidoreductase [Rhodobacterales]|jgi:hypothetical protein|uniref:molybdopterin-dependent oxidoreductase n=1 Tax=Rhodobacterales TaxID=204455 RepID=UPI00237FB2FE|nr:molybdopterin-dependent oxidoreductase [Phaeobacter gallaeciensis]MDE4139047.1 molybdopterin-dependent oxidoreductase [Phaeobacter gallaeciensis]MDE4147895.1 molybdopterin-dependent oxidoreductase [Phaeobacter gallaeciensis]MDE4152113.1 molybdopterin-dependent oxidoreductase [Phaeobacter gallaeciensis]MDE4227103.1 molybdopterin-dependent oxidoreductase [Phaeobacter gallaeciensis]MDE4256577.1 molybdopterin-dependent oxidoreductase [Phaeobacter gallaeciensis]
MIRWMNVLGALVLALGVGLMLGLGASAQAASDDTVLLTVQIEGDDASTTTFTRDQLMSLGQTSFETETIWTSGTQAFTGVSLKDLMAHLGVTSGVLQARAINDYMVEVPLSDAIEGGPIIAYERNGKTMSVRSKGPLWIVYPYDSNPSYKTEAIYSRSIWQLEGINVQR